MAIRQKWFSTWEEALDFLYICRSNGGKAAYIVTWPKPEGESKPFCVRWEE